MEEFKDIEGYNGVYAISNMGNVLSKKYKTHRIIKTNINNSTYRRVVLIQNGIKKEHPVHRLVAEAFIPNPEEKPVVDHINSIKSDNRVENLRWATRIQNVANKHGYSASGFKGVYIDRNKFRTQIVIDGKIKCLGSYSTAEEAHEVYMAAARELHGDFAKA